MRDVKQNALGRKKTHIQGNVQIRSDEDLLALEVGIGQIGHGLLAGRHGLLVGCGGKMRERAVQGGFWLKILAIDGRTDKSSSSSPRNPDRLDYTFSPCFRSKRNKTAWLTD